ncbi:DUF6881 domain-containing protein [Thalassotalea litorea]|uniref:DUF6881 domain-containing protein n=1 Tax=Thalassotalea litorea TaxID=2020715 RepID=UPI0037355B3B
MRYIDVQWNHDFKDEPIRLVSEIGPDEFETRKLEFFPGGTVGYAYEDIESNSTRLGIDVVPSLEEINSEQEFEGISISKSDFEQLWAKYVPGCT